MSNGGTIYKGFREPVLPGETIPKNVMLATEQFAKTLAMIFVETAREFRAAAGDLDGVMAVRQRGGTELEEVTPIRSLRTVTTAGTALPLKTTQTFATALYMQAKSETGDNTGSMHVGLSALDMGVVETFELKPGETFTYIPRAGKKVDLAKIYVDADVDGEQIVYWYEPV